LITSIQLAWVASATFNSRPVINRTSKGATQLGLRTMSSNVAFGEKKTPKIRAIGESEACGSGAGTGGAIVAIEDPHHESEFDLPLNGSTREQRKKYHTCSGLFI